MKKINLITKIILLILIFGTVCGNLTVYADENLEEKFKLLEEAKKEYEEKFLNGLEPWRGKKYKYARRSFSGHKDEKGVYCFQDGGSSAHLEYDNWIKMNDYIYDGTKEHFKQYLNTENEKEKLKGYFIMGTSCYTRDTEYKEQGDIEAKVILFFVPGVKSSKWCEYAEKAYTKIYSEKIKDFIEIDGYFTEIYIRLVWENDKYVIKFMDNKPEGYDEFVARMKEHGIDVENIDYPSLINAEENVQKEIQEAEKKEFNTRQVSIGTLEQWIILVCGVLIFLIILINIFINKKSKRNL